MTPILLIFFGISPTTAVSSDLVAATVMKPIGGGVHIRRRTVRWELVRWLCIGSIPMAFAGVLILNSVGDSEAAEHVTKVFLGRPATRRDRDGVRVVVAGTADRAGPRDRDLANHERRSARGEDPRDPGGRRARPAARGSASAGSGSIIIICLMLLYCELRGAELVGTDLVQAVPLVASAAIAHIIVGDFELALTTSILI